MEAKAADTIGPVARGGTRRVPTVAADHAWHPDALVTPVGLSRPAWDERCLYGLPSTVTRDGLVDGLGRWWEVGHERCARLTPCVITRAHGPEPQSRRTPFRRRLVACAPPTRLTGRLASSPPFSEEGHPD